MKSYQIGKKHFEISFHLHKYHFKNGNVYLAYISTKDIATDPFTTVLWIRKKSGHLKKLSRLFNGKRAHMGVFWNYWLTVCYMLNRVKFIQTHMQVHKNNAHIDKKLNEYIQSAVLTALSI